jgi:glycosyltransferase involved in cell wall biosynthesis
MGGGSASRQLRVGVVGTFPPRQCGLATFTADVAASLRAAGAQVVIAALVDHVDGVTPGATYTLMQTSEDSARQVAMLLSTDVDVVLVEHEFGIFGGEGSAVLQSFTDNLTVPYAITLHTVLARFERWQAASLSAPLAGAAMVLAFSDEAVHLLATQFPGVERGCVVVPHAAPTALFDHDTVNLRSELGLADSTMVISTFGLLSPSKGIENVIRAMPIVRRRVGDVVYLVAGRTHPEIVRRHGERYRGELESLSHIEGVDDVVQFRNWFHDVDELAALLHATDLFVTPYPDAEQIVSGALSFAIAAGVPFVSTPYRYATGLAAQGCGVTVPFRDDAAMATTVSQVLTDGPWRRAMAQCAETVSAERSWPQVGHRIHDLLSAVVDDRWAARTLAPPTSTPRLTRPT